MLASSHVLQLSLNFVENVILHLFVLAVTSARAVMLSTHSIHTAFRVLEALLEAHVKLLTDSHGLSLLVRQSLLMLLNLAVQSLRHAILRVVVLHKALLKLSWAEDEANLRTSPLITLIGQLRALRGQPAAVLSVLFGFILEVLQLLKSIALVFLSRKIVRGHVLA